MSLHSIPIASRSPQSNFIQAFLYVVAFDLGCILCNATHFVLAPLLLTSNPSARQLYEEGIRFTKGVFGTLLGEECWLVRFLGTRLTYLSGKVLMSQWFAPTSIELTLDGGLRAEDVVVRDPATGRVTELLLPPKHVVMGNHQVRSKSHDPYCRQCMGAYVPLLASFADLCGLVVPLVLRLFCQHA